MMNSRGKLAIMQIFILVFGIVAISYAIGSSVGVVNSLTSKERTAFEKVREDIHDNEKPPTTPTPVLWYENIFKFNEGKGAGGMLAKGGLMDGIVSSGAWALTVYTGVKMVGGFLGLSESQTSAAATAASVGTLVGTGVTSLAQNGNFLSEYVGGDHFFSSAESLGWTAGIAVAAIIFLSMYKNEEVVIVNFNCLPWDAPVGGGNCEKCNDGDLPCSEYQCRSLGQACELLNPESADEAKCTWVNKNDVEYPVIEPFEDALLPDYEYTPDNTISPPDRGVIIKNTKSTTGCVKAFTPLSFGVKLNEPAKCKTDVLRKSNFDDMEFYFGGSSLFRYNHTQVMSLPGPSAFASENLTLQNDGDYELSVRCQDANGNYNTANFVFKFCVEKGPDTTPPLIVATNIINGMPIAYNQTGVDLEAYINEPAECRWSHLDQDYEDMEEKMYCASSIQEMNAQMVYPCSTTLTGLKSDEENKFYFRCRDKPLESEDRNTNTQSYEFNLIGTRPIAITSVGPNGTVKDSTESVKAILTAETFAGFDEGKSACYYSEADDDNYIMFFGDEEMDKHNHTQDLYLAEGEYNYSIKCVDLGGNFATNYTSFTVESDSAAPLVVRAYHEETYLKIVTNENATCVYDNIDCTYLFEDGTQMAKVNGANHFTDWNPSTEFYIKCRDEYGNGETLADSCSIIVRPFTI